MVGSDPLRSWSRTVHTHTHTHSPRWGASSFPSLVQRLADVAAWFRLAGRSERSAAEITKTSARSTCATHLCCATSTGQDWSKYARTWKRTFLIPMVTPAEPVTRNRVILPESEKCLLFLGFSACNLTLNGFLRSCQRRHGSCRQPFPKRGWGPIHVTGSRLWKKGSNRHMLRKPRLMVPVLRVKYVSIVHSLLKHVGKAHSCKR